MGSTNYAIENKQVDPAERPSWMLQHHSINAIVRNDILYSLDIAIEFIASQIVCLLYTMSLAKTTKLKIVLVKGMRNEVSQIHQNSVYCNFATAPVLLELQRSSESITII